MIVYFQIIVFNEKKNGSKAILWVVDRKRESKPPGNILYPGCPTLGIIFRSGCGCGSWTSWLQTWIETWSDPCLQTSSICRETLSGTWSECETYGNAVDSILTCTLSEIFLGRRRRHRPLALFKDPDPSSSKFSTIQLVQSILHVAATPKLGNSFSPM